MEVDPLRILLLGRIQKTKANGVIIKQLKKRNVCIVFHKLNKCWKDHPKCRVKMKQMKKAVIYPTFKDKTDRRNVQYKDERSGRSRSMSRDRARSISPTPILKRSQEIQVREHGI